MKKIYEFVKNCGTYYLATTDANKPRIRPFGTIAVFEGKLYFFTDKTKNVARQILENPKVEICCMADSKWLRLEATAVEDDRTEARQHMLETFPFLTEQYSANDDRCQVFYLSSATATFLSFTDIVDIVNF